jgi:hypothetical protein
MSIVVPIALFLDYFLVSVFFFFFFFFIPCLCTSVKLRVFKKKINSKPFEWYIKSKVDIKSMKTWAIFNRWSKMKMKRTLYLCMQTITLPIPMVKDVSFPISLLCYFHSLFLKHPLFIKWYIILERRLLHFVFVEEKWKKKKRLDEQSTNWVMKLTSFAVTLVFLTD